MVEEQETPIVLETKDNELVETNENELSVFEQPTIFENNDNLLKETTNEIDKLNDDEKEEQIVEIKLSFEHILLVIVLICFGLALIILEAPFVLAFMFLALAMMALGGYIVLNPSRGLRLLKTGLYSSIFLNGMMLQI